MTLTPALKCAATGGAPRLVEPTATRRAGERVANIAASGRSSTEAAMIIHPHEVMRDFARPKIRNRVPWHKRRHWWTGRDYYLLAGWIIAAAVVIPVWLWVLLPAIRAVIRLAY